MQRVLVHDALRAAAGTVPDPVPAGVLPAAAAGRSPDRAASRSTFRPRAPGVDELNRFRSPAQRRLIFEEFFLFQLGLILRKRQSRETEQKPRAVQITDAIRDAVRRVLPFRLTGDQKTRHRRDRRRHAADRRR